MYSKLRPYFDKLFPDNKNRKHYFFAPGRINIIGEQVAYSGGNLLAAAAGFGIHAVCSLRTDSQCIIFNLNYKQKGVIRLNKIVFSKKLKWLNYAAAILYYLKSQQIPLQGLDILLYSQLPQAAGLSSSAALQVLFFTVFSNFCKKNYQTETSAALLAQISRKYLKLDINRSEYLPVLAGRRDHYLLIDCNDFRYKIIPNLKTQYI
ncbi:MAG TPA: galactokinase family protein, partial [Spirochaetota bacterium]|nr:galactokinase family protein [Spirochaetota bacterium]